MKSNKALSLINKLTSFMLTGEIKSEDLDRFVSASQSRTSDAIDELPPDFNLDTFLMAVEKEKILLALERADYPVQAAGLLGITFRSFRYRCHKLGINLPIQDADAGDAVTLDETHG
jgi:hypothetical protein